MKLLLAVATLSILIAWSVLADISRAIGELPCIDPRGCPDLIVDQRDLSPSHFETRNFASGDCAVVEGFVPGPGTYKLMRFTTTYPNLGPGSLIVGNPADHSELFEFSPCHGHYHFKEYADYRLWTVEGYQAWNAIRTAAPETTLSRDLLNANPNVKSQMVESAKRGFCVIDVRRIPGPGSDRQTYTSCANNQGISVGWADQYDWRLDGQWINVTTVAPGDYVLEVEVNAEHVFTEEHYGNNSTSVSVRIR